MEPSGRPYKTQVPKELEPWEGAGRTAVGASHATTAQSPLRFAA